MSFLSRHRVLCRHACRLSAVLRLRPARALFHRAGGWRVDVRDKWERNIYAWGPLAASMPLSSFYPGKLNQLIGWRSVHLWTVFEYYLDLSSFQPQALKRDLEVGHLHGLA